MTIFVKNMPTKNSKTVPAATSALTTPSWLGDWPVTHGSRVAGSHVNTEPSGLETNSSQLATD